MSFLKVPKTCLNNLIFYVHINILRITGIVLILSDILLVIFINKIAIVQKTVITRLSYNNNYAKLLYLRN